MFILKIEPKTKRALIFIGLLIILSIVGIQAIPDRGLVFPQLINSGHALVFFLGHLFLLTLLLSKNWNWKIALTIALFSISLGAVIEILQPLIGRNRSLLDLYYDGLGILFSTLLFYLKQHSPQAKPYIHAGLVSLFVLLSLSYPAYHAYLARQLNSSSVLLNFERYSESKIIEYDQETSLQIIEANAPLTSSGKAGKISISGGKYPGLSLTHLKRNWTGYTYLKMEVVGLNSEPFKMNLRIHDQMHNQEYNDRYNLNFQIQPGLNSIMIDIDSIRHGPLNRELDLRVIESLKFFLSQPEHEIHFILDDVRLE